MPIEVHSCHRILYTVGGKTEVFFSCHCGVAGSGKAGLLTLVEAIRHTVANQFRV